MLVVPFTGWSPVIHAYMHPRQFVYVYPKLFLM